MLRFGGWEIGGGGDLFNNCQKISINYSKALFLFLFVLMTVASLRGM